MGNGFCLYGRDPVFADVDAHLAQIDADEEHAEHVESFIGDAVEHLLHAADDRDILCELYDSGNVRRRVELDRIYNRDTGECEADSQDEWQRVMLLCADEHLPMLRQQWRDWCEGQLAENAEVVKVAERLAAEDERDHAEMLAAERAS